MPGFKFTSAAEKFVVVFRTENELMFAEIRNFPIEKELWEVNILFNPGIKSYIVMIVTADNYVCHHPQLTGEECNIILNNVRKTYFKG